MRLIDMNWMQVETYLQSDDRAVLPIGSTEQHARLSLGVDSLLSERVAAEAAAPVGVPVLPTLSYGISPYFSAYPGTVSLRISTLLALVTDIFENLRRSGFRRVLIVNGHGGNAPVGGLAAEWVADHPEMRIKFHYWWNAPRTWKKVMEIDPVASHASWMENFPWTRLPGVEDPDERKPMVDLERLRLMNPAEVRQAVGDGNFGGWHRRPDADTQAIWDVAVEEVRAAIEGPWS